MIYLKFFFCLFYFVYALCVRFYTRLKTYMAPSMSIFGDFTKDSNIMYNNFRVYGTIILWILGMIVFIGVKFVNKFGALALACVLLSILSVYIGIADNAYGSNKLQ